mgnify:CR=1 FL=1
MQTMFKEAKRIAQDPNKIKNQIELGRINKAMREKYWNPDGTMKYGPGMTAKEWKKAAERAKKAAEKWY